MVDDFGSKMVQVHNPRFLLVQNVGKTVFYDNSSGCSVSNEELGFYDNSGGVNKSGFNSVEATVEENSEKSNSRSEHEDCEGEDTDLKPTAQCAYKDLDKFADEHKIDIRVTNKH